MTAVRVRPARRGRSPVRRQRQGLEGRHPLRLAADRLTELRCAGAFAGLAAIAAVAHRHELRVHRRELAFLAVFGVGGVALVQWTYFVAIGRLGVGVALLIRYVGPLLVACARGAG